MFFCPVCKNLYEISSENEIKDSVQTGGTTQNDDYDKIIEKIINKEEIAQDDLVNIDIAELFKYDEIKKLSNLVKKNLRIQLTELKNEKNPNGNQFYFRCGFCKNTEVVNPMTKVYSKILDTTADECHKTDYSYMFNEKILPHTKNYTCPNKKCPTNTDKDFIEGDAVFFRDTNSYKIIYQCTACKTIF